MAGTLLLELAAQPALGQLQSEEVSAEALEEVVVTGSYLRRTATELAAPVTVLTAEQIQASGLASVTDVLRTLPADNSGSIPTAFSLGFSAGSAGVALRGLTVNSTLVLVNGRRAAAYAHSDDGERSFVDLNTLPLNPVERIEVLKDGASSLYGADAIAGVVNLILRQAYTGTELGAEGGTSEQGGGTTTRLNGTIGHGNLDTDGYNVFASVEWQADDNIAVSERRFPFNSNDLSSIGGLNLQRGQPGTATGTDYAAVQPATLGTPGDLTSGVAVPGSLIQTLRPCGAGSFAHTDSSGSYCTENQARYQDNQPEQDRFSIYGRFTWQADADTQAYLDANYSRNSVRNSLTPSQINNGTPHNTNSIALPVTVPGSGGTPVLNPSNPFAVDGQYALINYQFGDIEASASNTNNFLRVVGGVVGRKWGWDYDTAVVVNHTWLDYEMNGLLSYSGLMDAVTNGTYDFVDPAGNSSRVRKSLSPGIRSTATTNLNSIDLRATRNLRDLPGGPLGLALGVEARYESQDNPGFNADFDTLGLSTWRTKGSRDVYAGFFEVDAPFGESLDLGVSGRYDYYSDFGGKFSPKIGVKWTPVRSLALRGTYSTGFRAPSFAENGNSVVEVFAPVQPPDSWAATHGYNAYTLPYFVGFQVSTNPDLDSEDSVSTTFGVVYSPSHWLSLIVDYYWIRKDNVIVQAAPGPALDAGFAGEPPPQGSTIVYDVADPAYPDAVPRPTVVGAPYVNANKLTTDGIDFEATARFEFPSGATLVSGLSATEILNWEQTYPGSPSTTLEFAGTQGPYLVSSGAGMPRYRGSWVNTVSYGKASATAIVYYTSSFRMSAPDLTFDNSCFSAGSSSPHFPPDCRVGSFTDVDLTAQYEAGNHVTASMAIMNVFDAEPPIDPINYAGTNYNPTYHQAGIVGRFWKVGLQYRF